MATVRLDIDPEVHRTFKLGKELSEAETSGFNVSINFRQDDASGADTHFIDIESINGTMKMSIPLMIKIPPEVDA